MYSHDGLKDSLTHLAAPTLLYEELRRELARAVRCGEPISLIRFVLSPSIASDSISSGRDVNGSSKYETEIITFSHCLALQSRDEDICARMGEREFLSLLRGGLVAAERLSLRIFESWRDGLEKRKTSCGEDLLNLSIYLAQAEKGETSLTLLNRLDTVSAYCL